MFKTFKSFWWVIINLILNNSFFNQDFILEYSMLEQRPVLPNMSALHYNPNQHGWIHRSPGSKQHPSSGVCIDCGFSPVSHSYATCLCVCAGVVRPATTFPAQFLAGWQAFLLNWKRRIHTWNTRTYYSSLHSYRYNF